MKAILLLVLVSISYCLALQIPGIPGISTKHDSQRKRDTEACALTNNVFFCSEGKTFETILIHQLAAIAALFSIAINVRPIFNHAS